MKRLPSYTFETLLADMLAGLTGAVAGAPQAMGFALVAGISPIYGLYTAIVTTIVGALTTSSSFLTVGPTNALALVVFSTLIVPGEPLTIEKLFVLTTLTGMFQFLFGLLKLGDLTRFVSNAVMTGFITGAGLLVILGQLDNLTGYAIPETVRGPLPRFANLATHFTNWDIQTLVAGILAGIIIVSLHHIGLRNYATLTALTTTSIMALLLSWGSVEIVRDIADIPSALPAAIIPDPQYAPELLPSALALAVLALVQSSVITRSIREKENKPLDTNRDFMGQGIANIVGGFFQSMPTGGSLSRTAVNINAGARTRLANIFAGIFVAVILLALSRIIERIILTALAAHLITAAASLISIERIRMTWRVNTTARVAMLVTFISTLVLPLQFSIYVGVAISLGMYVYTSAHNISVSCLIPTDNNHFREIPIPDRLPDHAPIIFSIHGHLYFAAVHQLEAQLPPPDGAESPVVILRLRGNTYLGSTGIEFLKNYADKLRACNGKLILTGVSPQVCRQLEQTGTVKYFGAENVYEAGNIIFSATESALEAAQMWLKAH
ncbi:MAG: SulP family inorganic anion transporter [Chloroflexi bacterium]|nr:MAG: SulP family inorganic anion transporter [Chloroflexota bacterium]